MADTIKCPYCKSERVVAGQSIPTVNNDEYAEVRSCMCEDCLMPFVAKNKVQQRNPLVPEGVDLLGQTQMKNARK